MTDELRTALEALVRGLRMGTVMDPPVVYLAANMADWIAEAMDPAPDHEGAFDPAAWDAGYAEGRADGEEKEAPE